MSSRISPLLSASAVVYASYNEYNHTINKMITEHNNNVIDLDFVDSNYDSETGIIMIEINGDVNLINQLIGRLAIKGFNVETIQ